MTAKHALARLRAPDEPAAAERAWMAVRRVYPELVPAPRRRPRRRFAQALLVTAGVAALVLSSALASVRLFSPKPVVRHVVAQAVSTLPAAGAVLVSGLGGTWTVAANGSARRLGAYGQATWSPHGEYVAVAGQGELRAVTPQGRVVWKLERPDVSDPRWYAENGWRIAYRSGSQLRVVAGDGTGDHLLAARVAPVAPAWRPNHPYQLAYLTATELVIRDADSGKVLTHTGRPVAVRSLAWSDDGSRLLALTPTAAVVYGSGGRELISYPGRMVNGSLSPDGRSLALIRGSDLLLESLAHRGAGPRRLLSAAGLQQVVWSPDGRWLLVSWPLADEWLFVPVARPLHIVAITHVREQFHRFPRVEGWCCTAGGMS